MSRTKLTEEERKARKRARYAAYHAAHRAERKAYNAAYDAAHREERAAYRAAHREERAAYQAAYRVVNSFGEIARHADRRQRKRGLGHLPRPLPEWIETAWLACDGHCELCGTEIQIQHPGGRTDPHAAALDCVVPDRGYQPGNLAFLCSPCNRQKDNHTIETVIRLLDFLQLWEKNHAQQETE